MKKNSSLNKILLVIVLVPVFLLLLPILAVIAAALWVFDGDEKEEPRPKSKTSIVEATMKDLEELRLYVLSNSDNLDKGKLFHNIELIEADLNAPTTIDW